MSCRRATLAGYSSERSASAITDTHFTTRSSGGLRVGAGLTKRVMSHTFRPSFATHLLADGYDIPTVQELLRHKDVRTSMVYTHVLNRGGRGVRSPADGLGRDPNERYAETAYDVEEKREIRAIDDYNWVYNRFSACALG